MRPIPLRASLQLAEGKTRRAIVKLLKTEGPADSARLARRLRLTPMAVRQHLYALQRGHLVTAEERPGPLGRPERRRPPEVARPQLAQELRSGAPGGEIRC